jgi:hypothetical protein
LYSDENLRDNIKSKKGNVSIYHDPIYCDEKADKELEEYLSKIDEVELETKKNIKNLMMNLNIIESDENIKNRLNKINSYLGKLKKRMLMESKDTNKIKNKKWNITPIDITTVSLKSDKDLNDILIEIEEKINKIKSHVKNKNNLLKAKNVDNDKLWDINYEINNTIKYLILYDINDTFDTIMDPEVYLRRYGSIKKTTLKSFKKKYGKDSNLKEYIQNFKNIINDNLFDKFDSIDKNDKNDENKIKLIPNNLFFNYLRDKVNILKSKWISKCNKKNKM